MCAFILPTTQEEASDIKYCSFLAFHNLIIYTYSLESGVAIEILLCPSRANEFEILYNDTFVAPNQQDQEKAVETR